MVDKIKTDDVIVVEGKYDRIRVASVVDGVILETDGFAIFSENELKNTLKKISEKHDIIIMTDSDSAGFKIRSYISSFLPKGKTKHALIPDIAGKERRKESFSKEGKLGVEGMSDEIIRNTLLRAGINSSKTGNQNPVTTAELYELGLTGKEGSAEKRRELMKRLSLPQRTGTNLFLTIVNAIMNKDEFIQTVKRG